MFVAIAIGVGFSIVPVIGRALALKRRLNALSDSQLFVAMSAAETDFTSLQRSLAKLTAQLDAVKVAFDAARLSIALTAASPIGGHVRSIKTAFRELLEVVH